jgi:DnaK suppressor protein
VDAKKRDEFRRELEEMLQRLSGEIDRMVTAVRDEYQVPGEHDARPSQTVDKQVELEQNEEELHRRVRAALDRIEAGSFGNCESCGHPIPVERLRVIPYATFCVVCQERQEGKSKRSAAPAGS